MLSRQAVFSGGCPRGPKVSTVAAPTPTIKIPARKNGLSADVGVPERLNVVNVLITGAQPNTTGMTVNGLPPQAKAKIVPRAPIAPSEPAAVLQAIPTRFQLPLS